VAAFSLSQMAVAEAEAANESTLAVSAEFAQSLTVNCNQPIDFGTITLADLEGTDRTITIDTDGDISKDNIPSNEITFSGSAQAGSCSVTGIDQSSTTLNVSFSSSNETDALGGITFGTFIGTPTTITENAATINIGTTLDLPNTGLTTGTFDGTVLVTVTESGT